MRGKTPNQRTGLNRRCQPALCLRTAQPDELVTTYLLGRTRRPASEENGRPGGRLRTARQSWLARSAGTGHTLGEVADLRSSTSSVVPFVRSFAHRFSHAATGRSHLATGR